jgi:hypothetical protein
MDEVPTSTAPLLQVDTVAVDTAIMETPLETVVHMEVTARVAADALLSNGVDPILFQQAAEAELDIVKVATRRGPGLQMLVV